MTVTLGFVRLGFLPDWRSQQTPLYQTMEVQADHDEGNVVIALQTQRTCRSGLLCENILLKKYVYPPFANNEAGQKYQFDESVCAEGPSKASVHVHLQYQRAPAVPDSRGTGEECAGGVVKEVQGEVKCILL